LSGDLNEEKAKDVVSKLITLDYQNPRKDILFYIDSYGGDIHCLIAIHDAMKMVRCDVATICIGKAMSAAALLLIAGTAGKRFVTPNSRIMMHELDTREEGKLSYMKDTLIEAEKLQSLMEGFVRDYTKMNSKQVQQCFSKDFYMDAKHAKKLGVVDHIITHPDVLHKVVNI
jgi:ATP-dependent Clp protease protease subunit